MSQQMQIFRAVVLPEPPVSNSLYMIRDAATGKLTITGVDANGVVATGLTSADVLSVIQANVPEVALAAQKLETARDITITGDATWTVSFDGSANAEGALVLTNSGVAAGSYAVVTVDAKGRVTAGRSLTRADMPTSVVQVSADDGLIPANLLPSFVDDVIEVDAYDKLPGQVNDTGSNGVASKGKIYVVVTGEAGAATTKIYRWSGTTYIEIPSGVGTADTAVKLATARTIGATGDATWSVTFDGTKDVVAAITLADTGVVAGTYAGITFDSKGRATAARALIEADIPELTSLKVLSSRTVDATGNW